MLLDFHLARAPLAAGAPAPSGLGGTPGFMAPEQAAALTAVAEHRAVPVAVDGRADVYGLGVLLYSALGGSVPVPAEQPGNQLRRCNPQVTMALADLLERCLSAEPSARYASAGAVAADLRRHLADLPLRGVSNRSLAERWSKRRRRRPYALPLFGLLLLVILVGGLIALHMLRQTRSAEAAWHEGEDHLRHRHYAKALAAFEHGAALTEDLPFDDALRQRLQTGIDQAQRGRAAKELHQLCDRIRPLYGANFLFADQIREVTDHCRDLWQQREMIAQRLGDSAAPDEEQQTRADLLDLAILWTNLRVRLASPAEADTARRQGLEVLAQAEALYGPSCVLYHERLALMRALGQEDAPEEAAPAPRSAWEHYALGRAYLQTGDLPHAAEHLDRALEMQPDGLWPNFYKGVCAYRMVQYQEAVIAFSVCVALAPESAPCLCNRARAYTELGQFDRALRDYDRALRLDPTLEVAELGRADVQRRQERFNQTSP